MVGAAFFFSLMSLFVKLAGQRLPSMQIVHGALRGDASGYPGDAVARTGAVRRDGQEGAGRPRSVTGFVALSCFYYAVVELPLGDVTTLHYLSPVFTRSDRRVLPEGARRPRWYGLGALFSHRAEWCSWRGRGSCSAGWGCLSSR
jgi:hypothetical protein